jgi:hypothetical protein
MQHGARQRKEIHLDMPNSQACANLCNALFITRNWSRGKRFESARRLLFLLRFAGKTSRAQIPWS